MLMLGISRGIESLLDVCLFKAGSKILEVGFKKLLLQLELGNPWSEAGKLGECCLDSPKRFFGPCNSCLQPQQAGPFFGAECQRAEIGLKERMKSPARQWTPNPGCTSLREWLRCLLRSSICC